VDEVLRDAMAPVFRDLRVAGAAPARIEDKEWTDDPNAASAFLWSADGSGVGVYVFRDAPEAERVAALADQVQDWVVEELAARGASNWPPCPRHPHKHPLQATTRDAVAVWTCPTDGSTIAPIGAL
jgi:hypothetical protein